VLGTDALELFPRGCFFFSGKATSFSPSRVESGQGRYLSARAVSMTRSFLHEEMQKLRAFLAFQVDINAKLSDAEAQVVRQFRWNRDKPPPPQPSPNASPETPVKEMVDMSEFGKGSNTRGVITELTEKDVAVREEKSFAADIDLLPFMRAMEFTNDALLKAQSKTKWDIFELQLTKVTPAGRIGITFDDDPEDGGAMVLSTSIDEHNLQKGDIIFYMGTDPITDKQSFRDLVSPPKVPLDIWVRRKITVPIPVSNDDEC